MAIKSLDELRELRKSLHNQVSLREKGESTENIIEILIGLGTCGIAAGARDTFNTFLEVLEKEQINNVKLISVGCMGFCYKEPTIQINIPDKEPEIYGNITKDTVEKVVSTVIKDGKHLDGDLLIKSFKNAEVNNDD